MIIQFKMYTPHSTKHKTGIRLFVQVYFPLNHFCWSRALRGKNWGNYALREVLRWSKVMTRVTKKTILRRCGRRKKFSTFHIPYIVIL